MKKIQNNNIILGIPDGWGDVSSVLFLDKTKSDFNPNIAISKEFLSTPTDAITYGMEQSQVLKDEFQSNAYSIIEEGPTEINKIKAYKRLHRFVLSEITDLFIQQLQVYFVTKDHVITVTASDLAHRFDVSNLLFQEALNHLEILD